MPTVAVSAVAVFAVVTAFMVKRAEEPAPSGPLAQQAASASGTGTSSQVVMAPPLAAPDTKSMGAPAACKTCGVVQMVVALNEAGGTQPRAYQMHIRMDDGSIRTVEQRGALAAGSRVSVDGSSVKPL